MLFQSLLTEGPQDEKPFQPQAGLGALNGSMDEVKTGLFFFMKQVAGFLLECLIDGTKVSDQNSRT